MPDSPPRRVRIVSDGHPRSTRLLDAATGETIAGVVGAVWQQTDPGAVPTVSVDFICPELDVIAELHEQGTLRQRISEALTGVDVGISLGRDGFVLDVDAATDAVIASLGLT